MPFEEVVYPIFAGPFVLRMEMLGMDMDSPFADGAGSRTKVLNPLSRTFSRAGEMNCWRHEPLEQACGY